MKFKYVIFICFGILLLLGCSSLKNSLKKSGEDIQETAINNAILDFSQKCRLFHKDSVFSVSFEYPFYSLVLNQIDENNFIWENDVLHEGIVTVSIIPSFGYQFYYSEETKEKLPSRYVIKEGRLFYWSNDNYPVAKDVIDVLWKYNLLQEESLIPDFFKDSNKKGADYYFCKNELSRFKRVITNIGLGFYDPPKIKCNK